MNEANQTITVSQCDQSDWRHSLTRVPKPQRDLRGCCEAGSQRIHQALPKTTSEIRGKDGREQPSHAPTSHRLLVPLASGGGRRRWRRQPPSSGGGSSLIGANEAFTNNPGVQMKSFPNPGDCSRQQRSRRRFGKTKRGQLRWKVETVRGADSPVIISRL